MKTRYAVLFGSGPYAYSRSYDAFTGNKAKLAKNRRGQWCESVHDSRKKPTTWATRASAEAKAADFARLGNGSGYESPSVIEIGPNEDEINAAIREAAPRMLEVLRVVVASFGGGPSIDRAEALLRELGEMP